jgi:two-component system LytT family sensor kinase
MSGIIPVMNDVNTPAEDRWLSLRSSYWLHVVWWFAFIAYEQLMVLSSGAGFHPVDFIYFYSCNISTFYLQLWMLRRMLNRQPSTYLGACLFTLLVLALSVLVKAAGDYLVVLPRYPAVNRSAMLRTYLLFDLLRSIRFAGMALFFWLGTRLVLLRRKALEEELVRITMQRNQAILEKQLADSHNAFLQQRLNPHLLFNALGFVHSTVFRHSEAGADCLLQLTELLRYTLEEVAEDGKVALTLELEQVQRLLVINRYRYGQQCYLHFEVSGDPAPVRVLPLMLLTLAENIFKHGRVDRADSPALLEVTLTTSGEIRIHTANRHKERTAAPRKGGLGLQSLRTRLNHVYLGKHDLQITSDEQEFNLTLTIQL